MEQRTRGSEGLTVSAQRPGCVGMSDFVVNFLDTSDMNGPFANAARPLMVSHD